MAQMRKSIELIFELRGQRDVVQDVDESTGQILWVGSPPANASELQDLVIQELRRSNYPQLLQQLLDVYFSYHKGNHTKHNQFMADYQALKTSYPVPSDDVLSQPDLQHTLALQAAIDMGNIPNWATWTLADLQTWWTTNLADSIVDGFAIPANVKLMLKAQNAAILRIGQMEITLRDMIKDLFR